MEEQEHIYIILAKLQRTTLPGEPLQRCTRSLAWISGHCVPHHTRNGRLLEMNLPFRSPHPFLPSDRIFTTPLLGSPTAKIHTTGSGAPTHESDESVPFENPRANTQPTEGPLCIRLQVWRGTQRLGTYSRR